MSKALYLLTNYKSDKKSNGNRNQKNNSNVSFAQRVLANIDSIDDILLMWNKNYVYVKFLVFKEQIRIVDAVIA